MLNIHPSLLPKYRGLHTHQRAIDAGDAEHGATVHFVTEELDGGPRIVRALVPVRPDDSADAPARVLEKEHRIYPLAVRWFAEGRLRLGTAGAELDGRAFAEPVALEAVEPALAPMPSALARPNRSRRRAASGARRANGCSGACC